MFSDVFSTPVMGGGAVKSFSLRPKNEVITKVKRTYSGKTTKKLFTLLDLCVSSLRRGHANLLCIVPILTDDPRRESKDHFELSPRPLHPPFPCQDTRFLPMLSNFPSPTLPSLEIEIEKFIRCRLGRLEHFHFHLAWRLLV